MLVPLNGGFVAFPPPKVQQFSHLLVRRKRLQVVSASVVALKVLHLLVLPLESFDSHVVHVEIVESLQGKWFKL